MDLETLRREVADETARVLLDRHGFVPDQDSDEWETEYRHQFARVKQRLQTSPASSTAVRTAASHEASDAPPLRGASADARWAATLRAARLKELQSTALCRFLVETWLEAKVWLDTRDVPAPAFRRRVEAEYETHRRERQRAASAEEAARRAKAEEEAARAAKLSAAGVSAKGLVDLIDLSPRVKPAPLAEKLADLVLDQRRLRVFATANHGVLLVKESGPDHSRAEYGIERDDGLVADLKLFADAQPSG
jgi:activator of HSP90 ATPase